MSQQNYRKSKHFKTTFNFIDLSADGKASEVLFERLGNVREKELFSS